MTIKSGSKVSVSGFSPWVSTPTSRADWRCSNPTFATVPRQLACITPAQL
jgi:hypothetical protein